MSDASENKSKGSKTAGKIFFILTLILFIGMLCASWYIGGQDKAMKKYFSACTSGDLKAYLTVTGGDASSASQAEKDSFKSKCRETFRSYPEFAELKDTDMISYAFDVKERAPASLTEWSCSIKISFFSEDMSITEESDIRLIFLKGRWIIPE
ncbi:MAG: hypothetical protein ACI4KF_00270 [Huintestinicola sp.]